MIIVSVLRFGSCDSDFESHVFRFSGSATGIASLKSVGAAQSYVNELCHVLVSTDWFMIGITRRIPHLHSPSGPLR